MMKNLILATLLIAAVSLISAEEIAQETKNETLTDDGSRGINKRPSVFMQFIENSLEEIGGFFTETIEEFITPAKSAETKDENGNHHDGEIEHSESGHGDSDQPIKISLDHGSHHGVEHDSDHGSHGSIHPNKIKHGRDIGELRGKKKKKKKKALMKLLILGAVLKAKIELLLKLIATKLQVKFLIVAVIALLINIARFWIDLKKGHHPQKVIYYEHAQHQHNYDEQDDKWGYWKRSLNLFGGKSNNEPPFQKPHYHEYEEPWEEQGPYRRSLDQVYDSTVQTDSTQKVQPQQTLAYSQQQFDPQNLAYRNHQPYYT